MTDPALSAETKITLQLYGNSLPQLFENVAHDLLKTLINPEEVGETLREKVVVEAPDGSALLQEWVNTLLRLGSGQNIVFKRSRFQEFELERTGSGRLRADIIGELIDPQRHTFKIAPAQLRCERAVLLNTSKSIEAQVILSSAKIRLAK